MPLAKGNCKVTIKLVLLLHLKDKIKLRIWQCRSNIDETAQLNKSYLTQWQRLASFSLLYVIILFKSEVAIL